MKNLIKARIAPLFGFTARTAVIVCVIAMLALTGSGCILDKLIDVISSGSSEDDAIELAVGDWVDGSLPFYYSKVWYSFPVTQGNMYAVYQDDYFTKNSTKEADIMVSAKYQGDFLYITNFGTILYGVEPPVGSNALDNPRSFIASDNGTVLLLVQGASWKDGSFSIMVKEYIIDPTSDTPVTFVSVSADGGATTTTTTELTLTFSAAISGLSASDISLDGVPGIVKGAFSGSGPTYTLKISGFNSSGTVSVSVFKPTYAISGGPKTASVYCVVASGASTAEGLYTGIIGFNDVLTTKELSLLNNNTKGDFTSVINGLAMRRNSGLYFAVDNAITRLQTATLPDDLINVSIVTFTDGFDNASIVLNREHTSVENYRTAVKGKLDTVTIKDLNISAYSIGIKGEGITDDNQAAFMTDLNALASGSGEAKLVDNMDGVNSTFVTIANSLYRESKINNIALTIPGGYTNGTKIRFTFDNITNAASSTRYIEGEFSYENDTYSLTNVQYVGMSSSETTIIGTNPIGADVVFTFSVTSNIDNMTGNVKMWISTPPATTWDQEMEFLGTSDVEVTIEKKSAVVILVLDCTSSLGDTGFTQMKTAANSFINTLVAAQQTP